MHRSPELKTSAVTILLAAGRSRRFGADKRLYQVEGSSLLKRSISTSLALTLRTLVVLRPDDKSIIDELLGDFQNDPNIEIVFAEDADLGMGHSLSFAVKHLQSLSVEENNFPFYEVQAALVMLADMPWVSPETIAKVVASFSAGKIIIPTCKKVWGHPILFSSKWFSSLERLTGDNGAKRLLQSNKEALVEIEVEDEGILRDVDRPLA